MRKILQMTAAMLLLLACGSTAKAAIVTVGGRNYTYSVVNGGAVITSGSTATCAVSPKPTGAFTIPTSLGGYPVTSIGSYAFYYCSGLTSVTIPSSVTTIGSYAFSGCSGLTSVTIPSGVTTIASYAFQGCGRLTSVTIPSSVTTIVSYAFSDCSGLTSVTIPSSVTTIEANAFRNCSGLTSVTIPSSVTTIGSSAFYGTALWSDLANNSIFYVDDWVCGYKGTLSGQIILEDSTKGIANSAFSGCSSLTSVAIPSSVTTIGGSAFSGCSSLTSVTIPSGVTTIGSSAFYNCSGLTSVTIPSSVTTIAQSAFLNTALWNKLTNNSIFYVDDWVCGYKGTLSGQIILEDSTKGIANSAFSYCHGLTSVTIPSGVTTIGDSVFHTCSGLTSVTIPSGVTSIGNYAFSGCSGLTDVTIPSGVTTIEGFAFYQCSGLASVTIPSSVTSIGNSAFSGCSGLEEVYFHGNAPVVPDTVYNQTSALLTSYVLPSSTGWESEGSTALPALWPVTGTGQRMIAHASAYPLILNPQGGSVASGQQALYYNFPVGNLPEPVLATGVFEGWWTCLDGTGKLITPEMVVSFKEGRTLYAKWDINHVVGTSGLEWVLGGNAYAFPQGKTVKERPLALRSGEITHNQSTWIETTVTGPCRLAWWWNVSSEPTYDAMVCTVDGIEQARISGFDYTRQPYQDVGWQQESVALPEGDHVVRWMYSKDYSDTFGVDSAWLGAVKVVSPNGETMIEGVPVPHTWLDSFYPEATEDFEALAHSIGANDVPVWHSYVAGLVPTNPASRFVADIAVENGVPYISWEPNRADRVYTVVGKINLDDPGPWGETNALTRFFKVKVELPPVETEP